MTSTTATANGLLQAILAEPYADDLRLIYADALQDEGAVRQAAFIRLHVEIARRKPTDSDVKKALALEKRYRKGAPVRLSAQTTATLLLRSTLSGSQPEPPAIIGAVCTDWFQRRGLVEIVFLTLTDFMTHAAEIFAAAPVLMVMLTDCEPDKAMAYFGTYPSRVVTKADLSDTCVAYGRSLAGLPPL